MKKNIPKISRAPGRSSRLAQAAIIILAAIFLFLQNFSETPRALVIFPDQTAISAELARTLSEQARGLSGRASLDISQGMLFLFDEPKIPIFWMRGMNFPIDIIWLMDGRVVEIDECLPLDEQTYSPHAPVNQVLEVGAGLAAEHGLKPGDQLQIILGSGLEF